MAMHKWGFTTAILGAAAAAVLGFIFLQIWNRPLAAPENPRKSHKVSGLEQRRIELERERLAVEALRLKAQIRADLAAAAVPIVEKNAGADPAVQESLVDAIVAFADDRENKEVEAGPRTEGAGGVPRVREGVDLPPPGWNAFRPDPTAFEEFYEPLDEYGDWVEHEDYGPIWQPDDAYVGDGWAPYTNGSWGYSDYGWTWESQDPFGWACDHYGRWTHLHSRGWYWVPGGEWAPAWVSWRSGDSHVGWTPLPPCAAYRKSLGIGGWVDAHCGIGPGHYNFVTHANFGSGNCRSRIVNRSHNTHLVRHTTNVTRLHHHRGCVRNHGPDFSHANERSQRGVERIGRDVAAEANETRRHHIAGRENRESRPTVRRLQPGIKPDRGWGMVCDESERASLRAQIIGEARGSLVAGDQTRQPRRDREAATTTQAPRDRVLTAITHRPRSTTRTGPIRLPEPAAPEVRVIQRGSEKPSAPSAVSRARETPDHFAAEQARRDRILEQQRAVQEERERQIAARQAQERAARERIEQQIRERRERIAAQQHEEVEHRSRIDAEERAETARHQLRIAEQRRAEESARRGAREDRRE